MSFKLITEAACLGCFKTIRFRYIKIENLRNASGRITRKPDKYGTELPSTSLLLKFCGEFPDNFLRILIFPQTDERKD